MTEVRELLRAAEPAVVRPLDLDRAVRRGRSRRRRAVAASAVGACVVLSLGVASVQSVLPVKPGPVAAATPSSDPQRGQDGESVRIAVERWAAAAGYVPAMPVDVPDGYQFVFAGSTFFGPPDRTAISICTRPIGDESQGSCFPSEDDLDRPWFATTTVDGRSDVVVTTVSAPWSAQDLALWRDVAFTTELTGLTWLDEQEPGVTPARD